MTGIRLSFRLACLFLCAHEVYLATMSPKQIQYFDAELVRIQEGSDSFARSHNTYFSASCQFQSESEFELHLNCITFCLDRYPIKNEAGPAINNAEVEICRKIRFNTFKIRHVIKHYVNSKVSN
jgi:hypothetical protein